MKTVQKYEDTGYFISTNHAKEVCIKPYQKKWAYKTNDLVTSRFFDILGICPFALIASEQIHTVDKSRLKEETGDLNFSEIKKLREVLRQMFCE